VEEVGGSLGLEKGHFVHPWRRSGDRSIAASLSDDTVQWGSVEASSRPSFGEAPPRTRWIAFLLLSSILCLIIGGVLSIAIGEDCGKGTDRNCVFSLSPNQGIAFVGSLLCLLAILPGLGLPLLYFVTIHSLQLHPGRRGPWQPPSSALLDLTNSLEAPAAMDGALRAEISFRVDEVRNGPRGGCAVVGVLTEGTLRPPMKLRLIPGTGSSAEETVVQVVSAVVGHRYRSAVTSGDRCRLVLFGLGNTRIGGRLLTNRKWWIEPGDRLISL